MTVKTINTYWNLRYAIITLYVYNCQLLPIRLCILYNCLLNHRGCKFSMK